MREWLERYGEAFFAMAFGVFLLVVSRYVADGGAADLVFGCILAPLGGMLLGMRIADPLVGRRDGDLHDR